MYYSVRYSTSTASPRTPTIPPVLSWTDSDGNTVAGSPTETTNSVLSFISVDAKRKDITPYTCHISYVINSSSLATGQPFASNTPNSLSNPPTTATVNVLCKWHNNLLIYIELDALVLTLSVAYVYNSTST